MTQGKVPLKAMYQLKDAIQFKDMKKIKQILSYPNVAQIVNSYQKQNQQTPIFHAGLQQDEQFGLQVINMLLEKGADPYHKEQNKESIIFYLARDNKYKILERLLQLGYNLNQSDEYGWTPLFFAASNGRLKCAQLLIKNGNNVNHLDKNGQNSLFWAAQGGQLQMCKFLINRGCDPLTVDKSKKTAATVAKTHHFYHIVDYLNMFKKQKINKIKSNSQSIQIDKKPKRKDVQRNEYCLVYTAPNGDSRCLNFQQVEEFLNKNNRIKFLLQNQQELQHTAIPSDHIIKTCSKLLTGLLKRQDTIAFHQPVKWQEMNLYDYLQIIKEPMDYSTMKYKAAYNCYKSQQDFTYDIHLIYNNCIKYNGVQSVYGRLAQKLKQEYDQELIKEFTFFDD